MAALSDSVPPEVKQISCGFAPMARAMVSRDSSTAVLVVLRARVYWITHRSRSAWTSLDDWAAAQARSARRRGPGDRRLPSDRPRRRSDQSLIGASK